MAAYDFVEPYLRTLLGFIGIVDVNVVKVGGTSQLMKGAVNRDVFLETALEQVRAIAA